VPAFHIAARTRPGAGPRHDEHSLEGTPPARITLAQSSAPFLEARLDRSALTLTCSARGDVWHYFRVADGTIIPLPERPEPLRFSPGDAYIALSPGAQRIADRSTVARFLHLRDNFNADKLAASLLDHLVELAGDDDFPEDVTVLVVEAR
jgi:hypothetical protein